MNRWNKLKRWWHESAPCVSRKRYESERAAQISLLHKERMYNEIAYHQIKNMQKEINKLVPRFRTPDVYAEISEDKIVEQQVVRLRIKLVPVQMSVEVDMFGYEEIGEYALDALKQRAVDGWSLAAEKSIENAIKTFNEKEK